MTALADYTLPTTDEEVWRYSRIADLDLEAYTPADESLTATGVPPELEAALASVPVRGVTIVTVNGRIAHVDVAALTSVCAAFGGEYARQRTDCRLIGRGATGKLRAVYFGEADQMLDFRTFQDHVAPDTTSNLLFKGAVAGHSRSVYTGMIRV